MSDRTTKSFKLALTSSAASVILAAGLSSPVRAQDGEEVAQLETIIVTGSRIARPDLEASTPIAVLGSEKIGLAGQTNISDLLRRQPAFASGTNQQNTNFSTSGNGLNLLDLRGLSEDRTLVLINGRRVVAGQGGSSAVDVNMIPTHLVERVETITGGASAIYGSDAVAGVVNFILKKDFEGIQLNGQYGISSKGDAAKYRISALAGMNFGDNRGNITISGSYDKDDGLLSIARKLSEVDFFGRSVFAPQGGFNLNGTMFDFTDANDVDGNILGNDYTYGPDGTLKQGFLQQSDGFNRNGLRRILVPVERKLFSMQSHYEVTDSVTAYMEASYGNTSSSSQIEPYPAGGGDPAVDGAGSIDVVGGIPITNAFIPAAMRAEIAARNGDLDPANDVGFIAFRRRLTDVFDRSNTNSRDFYRAVVGVKGEAFKDWTWDVSYVYGQTKDVTKSGTGFVDRLTAALDTAVVGGQIVCADPAARANGCAPANLFGANTVSADAAKYITRDGQVNQLITKLEQHVVSAGATGTLFKVPAGDVKVALGAEYRDESSSEDWDADTNAGNTLGNFTSDTIGSFNVKELYGEAVAPILADRPLFHYLGLEAAIRYSDYSTEGTVWSWKLGGAWAPSEDIRFRAMYAVANRAPNVGELFSAQEEDFPGTLTLDPCNGVTATRNNEFDAACRAIPAVAQAIANSGSFGYTQVQIQSINGFDGGNPNLKSEKAKTWTIGTIITPRFAPRFNLAVDFYRIKISDAINVAPREDSVKDCLRGVAVACASVTRLPNGLLTRVDALNVNTGGFLTSGIDVALNYGVDIGDDSQVDWRFNYTHLLKHKRKPSNGAAYINERGQLQDTDAARLGSGFKHRFVLDTMYTNGGFTAQWTMRYLSKIKDTLDPATAPDPELNNVGARLYNDLQLRYALGEDRRYAMYVGVDNILAEKAPRLTFGATSSGYSGTETAQEYDAIGRFFYAGVEVKF